jgi:hypothetical protein
MKKFLLGMVCVLLSACGMNQVKTVDTKDDAYSTYRVPVVYGSGVLDNSANPMEMHFSGYDPMMKESTSKCLSSANVIDIKFGGEVDHKPSVGMHYHVLMVPPGYYALSMGAVAPYEAQPSIYFQVTDINPQYLGDFWIATTSDDEKVHIKAAPMEFHPDEAAHTLESFGIPSTYMKPIQMIPTDGRSNDGCAF